MEGVLKSWAVPKGPSLNPGDRRLAMQVEDHPVSYFDFEGIIPEGNYGAGTVMVWDVGVWEPLSPEAKNGKYLRGTDAEADAMLKKGDFKFRLSGKRLNGDYALIHIKARRPGSKGTEWLLIKKQDDEVDLSFNIDKYDTSVLSGKTMSQSAGAEDSAEWKSSKKAARGGVKAAWLADTLAKLDKKKLKNKDAKAQTAKDTLRLRSGQAPEQEGKNELLKKHHPKIRRFQRCESYRAQASVPCLLQSAPYSPQLPSTQSTTP